MKTQILGIGSSVRTDDSVGLHVVNKLKKRGLDQDVVLTTGGTGGIALLDLLEDCDRLIIVDAIITGAEPGAIHHLVLGDLKSCTPFNLTSTHGLGLLEVFGLRESLLDKPMPSKIEILAVEASDVVTLSEQCTPAVKLAVESAVEQILEMIA